MMRHSPVSQTLALRLAAAFLVLLAPAPAHAASVTWTNATGGDWNTAGNWSAGALPGVLDIAWITNRATSQTVDYNAPMAAASISNLVIHNGSAGLGLTNYLNINAGGFNVYAAAATTNNIGVGGVVNVNSGGVLTFGGGPQTWISGDSANKGIMNVQGGTVSNLSGLFYIGQNGQGVLNLSSGLFVDLGGNIRVQAGGPQGLLNIHGGTFLMSAASGVLRIGSGAGTVDAILTITNGSLIQNAAGGSVFVGTGSKRGILSVSGGTVTNKGDLSIGMGTTGGTTGLVVMTGGTFIQQGNMILGRPSAITDNTVGLFNMGGGTFSNTGALYLGANRFGANVNGFLTMTGGTWYQVGAAEVGSSLGYNGNHTNGAVGRIDITGGDFLASGASATFGRIAGSTGTLSVAGGNFVLTNTTKTAVLNLGPIGSGTFLLSNGTAWLDNLVATNAGGIVNFVGGTLNLRAATVSNAQPLTVGDGNAAATLNLVGSTYNLGGGLVATNSGAIVIATNTLTLAGADTAVHGGSILVQNGGATWSRPLTISAGGYVSKSGTNTFSSNVTLAAGASLAADSASIATIGGTFVNEGVAAFSNGMTVGANGVLNVQTGGLVVVGVNKDLIVAGTGANKGVININGGVVTNTGINMHVGYTTGQGEVNVYDGALVDTVRLRMGESSSGFLNLFGGLVQTPWLSIGRSLGTSNAVNVSGGLLKVGASGIGVGSYAPGYVNLSGGTVTNAGILHLGIATDGGTTTGLVVQTAGDWVQSGEVLLGNDASGLVGVSGLGLFTLGGGNFANAGNLFLGSARYGAGQGKGFLTITGGAWRQSGNVVEIGSYIGGGGNWTNGSLGRLDLLGGSFSAIGASEVVWLGRANLSTGTVNVAGGAFAATNATGTAVVNVGSGGLGSFLLSNGTAFVDRLIATGGAYSVVNLVGGALDTRATTVSNGQQFVVGSGGPAAFNLRGGAHSFGDGLQVSAGSLLSVTNAAATVSAAAVTNLGTVSVMNGRATFNGNVVNLGSWVSDPSTNTFNGNYTVGKDATVVAAAGDVYAFGGDFTLQSTNAAFNMAGAIAHFGTNGYGLATTTANHTLDVGGSGALDIGSGYSSFSQVASNFAIGTLSIGTSNRLTLTGTKLGALTNALYVGVLDIAWASTNSFAEVTNSLSLALDLPNINLYYDIYNPQNAWLNQYIPAGGYNLWGGGMLLPIPEPSTAALFTLLAGALGLRRLRRRA